MHILQSHGRDNYLSSLSTQSFSFSLHKLRFFTAFRVILISLMITSGLSCTLMSVSNDSFYHPLIYQVAIDRSPDQLILAGSNAINNFPQQTLQLLQVSVDFFYLIFLLILIMLCLALGHELPKKVALMIGTYKANRV